MDLEETGKEIAVPAFTRDDFIKTTKPFEWLYEYRNNKFLMSQLCAQLASLAGEQHVKNFKTLWKAYLETMAPTKQSGMTNATEFTDQPLELSTGEWYADDCGITSLNKFGDEVVACNHPVLPVQRLVNIDTDTEKLKLAYKKKNGRWRTLIADKRTLASANSIVSLSEYGIAVNSENAKYLVKYLTDVENYNIDVIPEINSVGRLGWIDGYGFSPYVDDLVFDGDVSFKSAFESVGGKGRYEKWIGLAEKIRKGGVMGRILLAASFASVLVKPCNALPFFVHLWGGTEAGKTVALMLAASVWANPQSGEYVRTFNSTQVGQELFAGFVNSMPLILDELQIVGDRKDFDKMIYTLSEGIGRSRGAKTGGLQKVNTWSNCILTSGEQPITTGSSMSGAVNRIVEIDCKDEKLFEDPHGVVEVIKSNYGFAGREFVELLQEGDNMQYAVDKQKGIYRELSGGESTEKQAMAASIILTADSLIDEWIFKDGRRLSAADIEPFLMTKKAVSANHRAYDFIFEFVAGNRSKFITNTTDRHENEVFGLIDEHENVVYFIKSAFDRIMLEHGYNPTAFLSWAKTRGLIIHKRGRNTLCKRINGTVCNCVCLYFPGETESDEIPGDIPF